jgi:hypothetical protein
VIDAFGSTFSTRRPNESYCIHRNTCLLYSVSRSWASTARMDPFFGCGGLSFGLFQNHLYQLKDIEKQKVYARHFRFSFHFEKGSSVRAQLPHSSLLRQVVLFRFRFRRGLRHDGEQRQNTGDRYGM